MNKVYKVVKVLGNGHRISCCAYGKYKINYAKNKTLVIGGNGALLFETKIEAKRFLNTNLDHRKDKYKIIEIQPIEKVFSPKMWTSCYDSGSLDYFYKKLYGLAESVSTKSPHAGAICCRKIKVLT